MKYKFFCPECDEEAGVGCASLFIFHRLDLPYFVCTKCRTIYYDKPLIRKCVTSLRKDDMLAKRIPHETLHQKAKNLLDDTIEHYIKNLDYRLVRFEKKEKQKRRRQ